MLNLKDERRTARLFISLAVPEKTRRAIKSRTSALRGSQGNIRWESAGKFHITLRFLGQTRRAEIGAITDAVRRCCEGFAPQNIKTSGVESLIRRRYPETLAVIVEAENSLFELKDAIDSALEAIGFEPEKRDFIPHITIGRARKRMKLPELPRFEIGFTADTVCLMESELRREGAVHLNLKNFEMGLPAAEQTGEN